MVNGKFEMNLFSNAVNLDITPGGFSPSVTSTAVPQKSREDLIEHYLYGESVSSQPKPEMYVQNTEPGNVSCQDMDLFLDQLLAKNLKVNTNENCSSTQHKGDVDIGEGDFSKLTLIDLDATSDKLIDSDELPQEFLQPVVPQNSFDNPFDTNLSGLGVSHYSIGEFSQIENKQNSEWNKSDVVEQPLDRSDEFDWKNSFEGNVSDKLDWTSVDDGEFHNIDYDQLDKDESDRIKWNDVCVEESFANKVNPDYLSFSGSQHDIEVTLKSSWITSPVRRYLKPGNKIDVEDLLKARSCKLGALNDMFEEKPSFGMGVNCQSPPEKDNQHFDPPVEENEPCNLVTSFDSDEEISPVELTATEFVSYIQENQDEVEESGSTPADFNVDTQLEETLNNIRGQLTSENMVKLCVMASKSNQPQAMLEKILEIANQQMSSTCNATEIETSLDILEIRKQKAAIKQERDAIRQRNEEKQVKSVETVTKRELRTITSKPKSNIHRDPPQNTKGSPELILNKLPTEVSPVEPCIVGIGAKVYIDVANPFGTVIHIKLKRINETLNGHLLSSPVLSFKADYYIQPMSLSTIMFHLCSRAAGAFCGLLEMSVEKDSSSSCNSRVLKVFANVEMPLIDVICEDAVDAIDFGIVPESCYQTKTVNIINKSKIMLPITMSVEKCSWGSERSSCFHSISANVLSCELPEDETAIFNTLKNRAPRLSETSSIEFEDTLLIMLDRPLFAPLIIKKVPIKAIIGKVSLRTTKAVSPLEIRGIAGELTAAEMPLLNGSEFPLTLRLSMTSAIFSTSVPLIVMESKNECAAKILFQPGLHTPAIVQCKLNIVLEPDGMTLEIPVVGLTEKPKPRKLCEAVSEPVKVIKKDIALECNRTSFVFGCVAVGESCVEKLKFINRWTDESLDLSLSVVGSNAFKIYREDTTEIAQFVRIDPNDKIALSVIFRPEDCNPHSGTVIIKPKGIKERVNFKLPAQGFGGKGQLVFSDWKNGETVHFGNVACGQSLNTTTIATNNGDRSVFVKLRIQPEETPELECQSTIVIQPETFRLLPRESRSLTVILTLAQSSCRSGERSFGALEVIYVDEILLRRFQKLKKRKIDQRKLSDVDSSILQFDWDTVSWDGGASEEDSLPSNPEDATVFLLGCEKLIMNLEATIEESDNMSNTTLHPVLFQDDTMTSMMYAGERKEDINGPSLEQAFKTSTETFKLFPPIVNLSMEKLTERVCVVSFSSQDSYIEIKNGTPWLDIQPKEATIPKCGFSMLSVRIIPDKAPYLNGTHASFQVFSENEVQTVDVVASMGGMNRQNKMASQHLPQNKVSTMSGNEAIPVQSSSETPRNIIDEEKVSYSKKKYEVDVPNSLGFKNTKVRSESVQKLLIKNTSSIYQQINANLDSGSFRLKHKQLTMKPYTSVQVPIVFQPAYKNEHRSFLSVHVVSENRTHSVQLYGMAV